MSVRKLKNLKLQHYKIHIDPDNILWLTIDVSGKNENVLDANVLSELNVVLDCLNQTDNILGLGLLSAKPNFIMGADINTFSDFTDANEITKLLNTAHNVLDKLEALKIPTVCGINGYCLGGGLEVALAFKHRIILNDEKHKYKSTIGFPEVKLGIYPGFGGTFRSISQLGAINALTMMLTGKNIKPTMARKNGIAQELVNTRDKLRWQMRRALLGGRIKKPVCGFIKSLPNLFFIRPLLAWKFKSELKKRVNADHYPAPYTLLDIWKNSGGNYRKMQILEKSNFAPLMLSETARNLQRIFHISNTMKDLAKGGKNASPISHIHVIGAGTMGLDIAMHCAGKGYSVTIQDLNDDLLQNIKPKASKFFKKRLKHPHLIKRALSRITPDKDGNGLGRADVVIEAVVENLSVKQTIFKDVEKRVSKDTILATNTSAIPLEKIATKMKDKNRLIGLHFFNPAHTLPLVEIIQSKFANRNILSRGAMFVKSIGKYPLIVKSSPGFLVNRVLAPYIMHALSLEQDGKYSKETIDYACRMFGMPIGPIELADTVGLDILINVASELSITISGDKKINTLIHNEHLGRKSGQGYYRWKKGRPIPDNPIQRDADLYTIAIDVLSPLWHESKRCLDEKIVFSKNKKHSADLIDGGIIFGTGFAPHLGGPLHYRDTLDKQ